MRHWQLCALALLAGCGGGGGGGGSSLAGTWELSSVNASTKGTMVLSATRLTITFGGTTFDLQTGGSPSLTWVNGNDAPAFTVARTAADVDYGALALGLGGDWMIHGPHNGSCVGSVRGDAITGGCSGVGTTPSGFPSLNRQIQVMRTARLDSIFGELGGSWSLSDNQGASCTATFSGATVTAKCNGAQTGSGRSVTVTVGDGVASGVTDGGMEFTARRL